MARRRIQGPAGAVVVIDVPGPGWDQGTYDRRIASGEYVLLDEEVEMPEFLHTQTGRKVDVADSAAKSFRASSEFEEVVEDEVVETTSDRPSPTDLKDAWVDWAQAQGYDTDGMTKSDLMGLG